MIYTIMIYLLRRHLEYYNLINTINLYYTKGILLYISILLQLITGLYITIIYYYTFYLQILTKYHPHYLINYHPHTNIIKIYSKLINYYQTLPSCQKLFTHQYHYYNTIYNYDEQYYYQRIYYYYDHYYNKYLLINNTTNNTNDDNNNNITRNDNKYNKYNRTNTISTSHNTYLYNYTPPNNIMPNRLINRIIEISIGKNNIIKRIDNKYMINEIYIGIIIRYIHSYNPTLIIIIIYLHIIRSLYYNNWKYNSSLYVTGWIIYLDIVIISFLGYILIWGQMSYWGCTVIINLLNSIPNMIEWIIGSYFIQELTIYRIYLLHFILPFLIYFILIIHFTYIHSIGTISSIQLISNHYLTFYPNILIKEIYLIIFILLIIYSILINHIILIITHTDNQYTINLLITPTYIIPEWYFLPYYIILKTSIPNNITSLLIFLLLIIYLS